MQPQKASSQPGAIVKTREGHPRARPLACTTSQSLGGREPRLVLSANVHGVNTHIVACFKLQT